MSGPAAATPRGFLRDLRTGNPALFRAALANVVLALVLIALMAFDHHEILGINRWIKPLKFASSIAIYLGTLGWTLEKLPPATRGVRFIAHGAIVAMTTEIVCIAGQAARGTTSHFNNATAFDGVIFGLMGLLITFNTVLIAWTLVLFIRHRPVAMSDPVLAGIQLGLAIFILASIEGGMIVANNAHTVGAPDGGPGLPIINWSTRFGDLRVAHFLGLHALQLLPLAGWVLARRLSALTATLVVWAVALVYLATFVLTLTQALAGHPLLSLATR